MSFTQEVKAEICANDLMTCCKKAELSALIQMCSFLTISDQRFSLEIKTKNPTVAKRTLLLLKQLYAAETELFKLTQAQFKKKYSYTIKVNNKVKEILEDLSLWDNEGLSYYPKAALVRKACCGRAYLAGAFLAAGSINSPISANYHWEIACDEDRLARFIVRLLARYDITAKVIQRRTQKVVYFKLSEKIGDFLRLVGASDSLMKFEDARIQRDYVNNIHRLDNCDIANEMKTQQTAAKQLEDIAIVLAEYGNNNLDSKLREIAQLRIDNPEASFLELSKIYEKNNHQFISKSGVRHRLNRISELAQKIRDKN